MTSDITDDSRNTGRADAVHVEEVTGHQTRASLVHPPDLETGEVRHLFGGETGRPRLRGELLLLEGFTRTTLDIPSVSGHTGLADRQARPPQGGDSGSCQYRKPDDHIGVVDDSS